MKHLLLTTIAAVVLVGCGESQQSAPSPEANPVEPIAEVAQPEPPPEPSTAKAPDISIHDAVEKGNIEAVKQHIAAGTDVNAKGGVIGGTPLHGAVTFGHKEIVELLIAKGADVNAKGVDGITPLDLATTFRHRRTEIADLLRKHGGKHSSIHEAAAGGDAEGVKEFLAAGTDVNAKDDLSGGTPLDYGKRHPETTDLLRKHGGKTSEELKAAGN